MPLTDSQKVMERVAELGIGDRYKSLLTIIEALPSVHDVYSRLGGGHPALDPQVIIMVYTGMDDDLGKVCDQIIQESKLPAPSKGCLLVIIR